MSGAGPPATAKGRATFWLRVGMLATALLLPLLSLIPLGSLWLWQSGYLLHWIVIALVVTAIVFLIEWRVVSRLERRATSVERDEPVGTGEFASAREAAAWQAVQAVASNVDAARITERDDVLDLCLRTVEAVALEMHPGQRDPLWRFTIPEALRLVERVAHDLEPFMADTIPLGDRLTVAQVLRIYRWRSVIGPANKAYDLWRLVRLLNPAAAATAEAREQLTKWLYGTARDEIIARLARGLVRRVGRAAIDLYGGRLKGPKAGPTDET